MRYLPTLLFIPVFALSSAMAHGQQRPGPADASGSLNIRAFGAKCDGVTDDYAAISRALQQASGKAGAVYFPPMKEPCMLSRALKPSRDLLLKAAPGTATLKATPGNASQPVLLAVADGVRVHGLSFDGGGSDHANGAPLVQGYQVANVEFADIAVRHSRGIGLLMSSKINNSTVRDSTFEDIGNGWKSSHLAKDRKQGVVFCCGAGNHGNSARNDKFSDIGLDALQFADQEDALVAGNEFHLESGQRTQVKAPDYPAAIFMLRVKQAKITDNVIEGAQGNCIDGPGISNAIIARNQIAGCGASGIGIFDTRSYGLPLVVSGQVVISGNTISRVGLWAWASPRQKQAIFVAPDSTDVSIVNNHLSQ